MTQYRTAPLAADAIVMMRDGKMIEGGMSMDGDKTLKGHTQ